MNEEVAHEKILRYINNVLVDIWTGSNLSGFRGQNVCKHYVFRRRGCHMTTTANRNVIARKGGCSELNKYYYLC